MEKTAEDLFIHAEDPLDTLKTRLLDVSFLSGLMKKLIKNAIMINLLY
jgi:hypothetical protein